MINPKDRVRTLLLVIGALTVFSACEPEDKKADSKAMYEIDVTNATNGQPLTPVAVVAHSSAYQPWNLGDSASVGLEMLAEGGDVTQFIADAMADSNVKETASSENGPFGPGATESVMIKVKKPGNDIQLSVVAMLANTNDAFTGVANVAVGDMEKGDSMTMLARVYDAGTEANSELAASIPGPAGGGEGFNATRDDTDFVSIHAGVVTADDGLSTSALNESHRWLGPAAKITITRTK